MNTELSPVKSREDQYFDDIYRESMARTDSMITEAAPEMPAFIGDCEGLPPAAALTALLKHLSYEALQPFMGRKFDIKCNDSQYRISIEIRSYTMYDGESIGVRIVPRNTLAKDWIPEINKLELEVYPRAIRSENGLPLNLIGCAFLMLTLFLSFTAFLLMGNFKDEDAALYLCGAMIFLPLDFGTTPALLNSICLNLAKHNHHHTAILRSERYAKFAIIVLTELFLCYLALSLYLPMYLARLAGVLLFANMLFVCTVPVVLAHKLQNVYLNQLLPRNVRRGSHTW